MHLDRLPTSEAQQEPAPLQEITGEGCKKLQGTPVKTYRGPLQKLTPEQVNEQVIKQVKGTSNSLLERTPWETDHLTNDGKKVEKPKKERAKPKTSCPFSPDDPIPPECLEYAQTKHPSINPQTEFTKFVNFHISKDNKYSNWLAAWRYWVGNIKTYSRQTQRSTNIRFEGHDNDFSCIYG